MTTNNLKYQFLKNVGSGYLAVGVTGIVGFIIIPLNMRMLGKDLYGISVMATAALSVFSFLSFGMGPTLLRFFSKAIALDDRQKIKEISSVAQTLLGGLGLLGGGLFLISFPHFMALYQIDPSYRLSLLALFAALAFSFWEQLFLIPFFSMIQGSNRYDLGNSIRIVSILLRLTILCLGYPFLSRSLYVLALSFTVESVFRLVFIPTLAFRCLGSAVLFSLKAIRWSLLPPLFSFSVINLANSIFFNLSLQVPLLIIGKTLGTEIVAAFHPAVTLGALFGSVLGITSAPLTPLASRDARQGGGNLGRWATSIAQFIACFGCGILVVFALMGRPLIAFWLVGQSLEWTNPIIMVTVFGVAVAATQTTNYNLALGGGTILPFALSSFFMFLLAALGTWLGTAYWGWSLLGVVIFISSVRVVRNVLFLAAVYSRLFHYSFLNYFRKVYLEPWFAWAGVVAASLFLIRIFPILQRLPFLIGLTLLAAGIYFAVIWRSVLSEDIKGPIRNILRLKRD